jgi:FlaG/FlaF family flagellin (archaellin)
MITQKKSGSGVSPVIGVLLMVSLTVILAAIIGNYVLDLAGDLQKPPQAGVSFNNNGYESFNDISRVEVVLNTAPRVDYVAVSGGNDKVWDGSQCVSPGSVGVQTDDAGRPILTEVGEDIEVCASGESGTLRAIGSVNGNEQVLQSHDFDFS